MKARYLRVGASFSGNKTGIQQYEVVTSEAPWMQEGSTIITAGSRTGKSGPIKQCIYCGTTRYKMRETRPLGGEHIVMAAIGGTLELLEASCQNCERATSAVDSEVVSNTFEVPRRAMKVRTRAKMKDKKIAFHIDGDERLVVLQLPLEAHPQVISMPVYRAPGILAGMEVERCNVSDLWAQQLSEKADWGGEYKAIYAPRLDMVRFAQFLAKIAHSYAIFAAGLNSFTPWLTTAIRTNFGKIGVWRDRHFYVGGRPESYLPSDALHELGLLFQRVLGQWMLVVRVRLFACLGTPIYLVVVGPWLGGDPPPDRVISITS